MIFTVISKEAVTYGQGKEISKDRFEQFEVVKFFFYDECAINNEFRHHVKSICAGDAFLYKKLNLLLYILLIFENLLYLYLILN